MAPDTSRPSAPLWLLAELTYRCPLHCAFCYNPVDFAAHGAELDTDAWRTVIGDARALGAAGSAGVREHYTASRMAEQVESIYREVAGVSA